jgi:hypothetical protein
LPETPLYARVDVATNNDGIPRLQEIELVEPCLFTSLVPGSAARFARAMAECLWRFGAHCCFGDLQRRWRAVAGFDDRLAARTGLRAHRIQSAVAALRAFRAEPDAFAVLIGHQGNTSGIDMIGC